MKLERCFQGAANVSKRLRKVPEDVGKAEEHLDKANKNLLASTLMEDNRFFD